MKKILHISNYYLPHMGGIELCTKSMVDALKQKYEQKVICFSSTAKNITDKDGTVEIIRCGAPIKMFSLSSRNAFKINKK